jgi:pteridine reductase
METQPFELAGRTAMVTGAAKRLGRAISQTLARQGANVVLHHRSSAAEADALAREIRALGREAWLVQGDLANPEQVEGFFTEAVDQAGTIDVLINNASIFPESSLANLTPEALSQSVNVNALAPLLLGRAMAAQSRDGAIVNLLDCRIAEYDHKHVPYHLSKRMLFSLTRMMAMEFAPKIRVGGVAPGLILPPEGEDESYLERLAPTNPQNAYGSPQDITDAVLFLVRSGFVTGQVIFVDGGRHMKGAMYG